MNNEKCRRRLAASSGRFESESLVAMNRNHWTNSSEYAILPKYDNSGGRIDSDVLASYAEAVADRFGGVTVTPSVLGCWSGSEGLVCEENMVIETVRTDASEEQIRADEEWFADLARRAGQEFGQEAIFTQEETDTMTSFVPGSARASLPHLRERNFFKRLLD